MATRAQSGLTHRTGPHLAGVGDGEGHEGMPQEGTA